MHSSQRQLSTALHGGADHGFDQAPVQHRRTIPAALKYPAIEFECFLLADTNAGLHADIHAQVKRVSNDLENSALIESSIESSVLELGLVTLGLHNQADEQHNELLISLAAARAMPVVMIADDPLAAHRSILPPNVIAVIDNSQHGAEKLHRVTRQLGSNAHQKIWLVGEFDDYIELLLKNLGYQVTHVDFLHQIDFADECVNLRANASIVVLNSSGARSYQDFDNVPLPLLQALEANESFSMVTVLDVQSCELKSHWQQLGVVAMDSRYMLEYELIEHVQISLQRQHRLITLQHDAVRDSATGIYNNNYLEDSGRRLHAAASRGDTSFAVVVIQLRAAHSLAGIRNAEVIQVMHQLLQEELRLNDVVAQRFPDELVCLVSSAERNTVAAFLERVCESLRDGLHQHFDTDISLGIGATAEQGADFDGMMHRATMAALQSRMPGNGLVVIL